MYPSIYLPTYLPTSLSTAQIEGGASYHTHPLSFFSVQLSAVNLPTSSTELSMQTSIQRWLVACYGGIGTATRPFSSVMSFLSCRPSSSIAIVSVFYLILDSFSKRETMNPLRARCEQIICPFPRNYQQRVSIFRSRFMERISGLSN